MWAAESHQLLQKGAEGGSWVPSWLSSPGPEPSGSRVGVAWPGCHVPAPKPPLMLAWQCPPPSLDLLRKARGRSWRAQARPHPGTLAMLGTGTLEAEGRQGPGPSQAELLHLRQAGSRVSLLTTPWLWGTPPGLLQVQGGEGVPGFSHADLGPSASTSPMLRQPR